MKKLFLSLCLIFTINYQADFNSALDLYAAGDHPEAYNAFLSMAEAGEKRSQFNLGVMYYYGQHVEKDINKAYAWMKLSIQSEINKNDEEATFQIIADEIKDKTQAEIEFKKLDALYSTEVLLDTLYPKLIKPVGNNAFQAKPTKFVNPEWPRKALIKGIQGWIRVEIDVDKTGVPRNIHLLDEFPKKMFARRALKALKRWRFEPKINSKGIAEAVSNIRYTMDFRIVGMGAIGVIDEVYNKTQLEANQGDANAQFKIGYWDMKLNDSRSKINPNEWFLKASIQGHPYAQYELGRSLLQGNGCVEDKSKGLDWLTRSAANGEDKAKSMLGSIAAKVSALNSQQKAVKYLTDVENLTSSARLSYAWMLATSPFEEIADPEKAIALSKTFPAKIFKDKATLYEIQAAAYAAMGNFKKAVSLQEDALDEAEDWRADVDDIKAHLALYKNKQKWF